VRLGVDAVVDDLSERLPDFGVITGVPAREFLAELPVLRVVSLLVAGMVLQYNSKHLRPFLEGQLVKLKVCC
jgi:hypothetical protein